jgi:hypothetical protein
MFWEEINSKPEFREHAKNLELAFQFATLTMNHIPLVEELQRMYHAGEISSLSDLVRFDEKEWQEIISRRRSDGSGNIIGFPSDIPGKDDNEKTFNYTRVMARMVEDTSTTAFIARRLEKESDANMPGRQDLLTFLNANPGFDFKRSRLESYLAENQAALDNISDVERTKTRITSILVPSTR